MAILVRFSEQAGALSLPQDSPISFARHQMGRLNMTPRGKQEPVLSFCISAGLAAQRRPVEKAEEPEPGSGIN